MHVVSDLTIGFRDPVLWFVRSLILLYAAFYIFSFLWHAGKKIKAIASIWILTIITCLFSYFSNGAFGLNSMSGIPLFSVGVMAACYSTKFYKAFNVAFIPLIASFLVLSLVFTFHSRFVANLVHSLADYAIIGTLLLIFGKYHAEIKIPSVLAAITFDVYLTHFKVLTVLKYTDLNLSIWLFVVATALVSLSFYLLRSRLLKF